MALSHNSLVSFDEYTKLRDEGDEILEYIDGVKEYWVITQLIIL